MGRKLLDIRGKRFGHLEVIARTVGKIGYWSCRCSCGVFKDISGSSLRRGVTLSCGCMRSEMIAASNTKHGHTNFRGYRSKTYSVWAGMKKRCSNPKAAFYANYGGRGIKVCERWQDFRNFLADMGEAQEGMSIDRVDVNGNYEPGNCKWSTAKEQATNRRPRGSGNL